MSTSVETACPDCGNLITPEKAHKCKICGQIICHLCAFFHGINCVWPQMGIQPVQEWPTPPTGEKETR